MYRIPENRTGRSVNDYDSIEALREALLSMERKPLMRAAGQDFRGTVPPVAGFSERNLRPDETGIIDSTASDMVDENPNESLDWVIEGYDEETSNPQELATELRRLAVLKSYRVIGSGRDAAYERLIAFASRLFRVPMAIVSVIDLGRQLYLSTRGMGDAQECPRKSSFCAHSIISKLDLIVIPDASKDWRFKDHWAVQGPPRLRFYAGAPLICPEGYRLGTLCIMDTKPRPEGLSLDEKQNLSELAAMVMEVMVEQRQVRNFEFRDPAQLIACTAHDLLTPLLGIGSSLSVIREDDAVMKKLSGQQRDVVETAAACSNVMNRICQKTVESFRERVTAATLEDQVTHEAGPSLLNISDLVKKIQMVMEPFPKSVPLIITVDPSVPPEVQADDLKIFRSAINFLTNACSKTEIGSVHLKIFTKEDEDEDLKKYLVVECEDTGPGVPVDKYQYLFKPVMGENSLDSSCSSAVLEMAKGEAAKAAMTQTGLGLYSVASQVASIGGKYGFRPRGFTETGSPQFDARGKPMRGSVFWFSVPLVASQDMSTNDRKYDSVVNGHYPNPLNRKSHDETWSTADEVAFNAFEKKSNSSLGTENQVAAAVSKEGPRTKKALIIEDSLVCRKTMARVLSKLGFEVFQAVNGMEGLRVLQTTLFDLVLCDFLMPVMDGLDCIQQYRQFELAYRPWFDQYIIGMSAHASERDIEKGLKIGMNDFRPKPVTMKVLKEIMDTQEFKYVNQRLDAIAAEVEGEQAIPPSKRRKSFEACNLQKTEEPVRVCLVAEEGTALAKLVEEAAERIGWKAIIVNDGEATLRLLQMRNWDAVLLDDELPGLTSSRCVLKFREWEKKNRVNRQKNVVQMSSSFIPSRFETSSSVQLPSGFDGALGKPLSMKALQNFLETAAESASCGSHDIVYR